MREFCCPPVPAPRYRRGGRGPYRIDGSSHGAEESSWSPSTGRHSTSRTFRTGSRTTGIPPVARSPALRCPALCPAPLEGAVSLLPTRGTRIGGLRCQKGRRCAGPDGPRVLRNLSSDEKLRSARPHCRPQPAGRDLDCPPLFLPAGGDLWLLLTWCACWAPTRCTAVGLPATILRNRSRRRTARSTARCPIHLPRTLPMPASGSTPTSAKRSTSFAKKRT